ncbi:MULTISPECIES: restriction endonuclease subunit S [Bacteroidaceae]|nr:MULTISPECIES: restriction endonuclease subunit S [Bacteroidaceae]MBU9913976.1 restriction endonuclease subunit S [Phocaeicola vulgatus]MBV4373592.1 restriction endonuclease subunit S [Bacteroides thetaiotaomicron]MCB6278510.1 restriction endonuclease subunit S [Phocaeicola vulgatus]MCB7238533.1 restriction endonuclease subunit S [Bacteroides thetaiotaomicron]MCB7442990.1 restriction endonuclease subunit S [Bacteroides thetaiotaomicron]
MNGKQLKNSILQWAIQGKLVPQDPNDEPASVLLDKIRQEKERLIKEKKIKRDKNASIIYRGEDNSYYEKMLATGEVKCIDEEIPFDVPQGWEWERWGNIAQTIQYGYNAPALEHGVIKMVRISDIQENCVLWDNVPYCLIDENDIDTYLLKVNDILFARTGGTVGKSFLVEEVPEKAIYAGYLIRTRYSSLLNPRYMKSFMESQLYWEQLKNGTIATAQPNCNGKTLAKMLLPIPPTKEQDRIVKKLTQLSSFLDNYGLCQDRLNLLNEEIKEQLKKSILQEAIQGKLVPQLAEEGTAQDLLEQIKMEKLNLVKEGKLKKSALATSVIFRGDDNKYWEKSGDSIVCIDEEIPFGIPSSWSWCRLGNIASVKGGKRIPVGEKLTTENTGHMYIRVADMKENTVKTDDIHYISESIYQKIKSYTISTEDLYITVAGTIGSVGEIPKVFDNANLTENADKIVFRGICKKFLMHCLLSNFVQSQIKKCTTKVGQPKLAIVRIEDLLIPLPPIKEQYRIVHKIEQTASIMS